MNTKNDHFLGRNYTVQTPEGKQLKIGSHILTNDDIRRLSGAPDESSIDVQMVIDNEAVVMVFEVTNTIFEAPSVRVVFKGEDGTSLLIENAGFMLRPGFQGKHIGLCSLAMEATAATQLGIVALIADAAGSCKSTVFNGYYSWPRMGFDAMLEKQEVQKLPQWLKGASTVLDVMATPEGREWWHEHGTGREMRFDLAEHSRSWQVLKEYLEEEGCQV